MTVTIADDVAAVPFVDFLLELLLHLVEQTHYVIKIRLNLLLDQLAIVVL